MSKYCFGVDVGGTTVKLGLFDLEGNVQDKWEIITRTEENGKNILPDVAKSVLDKMAEKLGHHGCKRNSWWSDRTCCTGW